MCKNFIWNGKRPRLHSSKLLRTVEKGGLGLPNALYYYFALSLRHLSHWSLPPERAPPWYKIEQSALPSILLLHSLSTKVVGKVKNHPIISHLNVIVTIYQGARKHVTRRRGIHKREYLINQQGA